MNRAKWVVLQLGKYPTFDEFFLCFFPQFLLTSDSETLRMNRREVLLGPFPPSRDNSGKPIGYGLGSIGLLPVEGELFLASRAVGEIEVDEGLIGDARGLGLFFEVIDGFLRKVDAHLLLRLLGIRVLRRFLKIVFLSHVFVLLSFVVAALAFGGLPCRYDADDPVVFPEAMADDEEPGFGAPAH